jgi:hypothetical protein
MFERSFNISGAPSYAHCIALTLVVAVSVTCTQPSLGQSHQKSDVTNPAVEQSTDTGGGNQCQRPTVEVVQSTTTEAPPVKPRGKPRFLDLRYDEDFSYLDGPPDSYESSFLDPIKHMHLGPDWRLTLGGEFRARLEAETNKAFGATEPAQDTFAVHRYLLHADLKYQDVFRVFAQGIAAFDEDRDLARRPVDENHWDLHQLFIDVSMHGGERPTTLRVGRQEFNYGRERLVSALNWGNVRRRFDGIKLFRREETWDLDIWWARPVPVLRKQFDRFNEKVDFSGAYFTYKAIPRHGLDVYAFSIHDRTDSINPNGRRGDRTVHTIGSRFWGKSAGFDYEAELAGQWGTWAGDSVRAWSWTIDGGHTWEGTPLKPRVGAGFDWASGDRNPNDGTVQTFDQLFPLGHAYFGYLDLIGRQNIMAANVNLSAWPVKDTVKTIAAFHMFWLTESEDALYNAGAGVVRRDPTGNSGREVGQELDLTLSWKLDVHSSLLLGYSHFWPGNYIRGTGRSEDADLFYVQYAFKF